MKIVTAQEALELLDGATIACSEVADEEGMHIYFQDGRVLVISGEFVIGIVRSDKKRLH